MHHCQIQPPKDRNCLSVNWRENLISIFTENIGTTYNKFYNKNSYKQAQVSSNILIYCIKVTKFQIWRLRIETLCNYMSLKVNCFKVLFHSKLNFNETNKCLSTFTSQLLTTGRIYIISALTSVWKFTRIFQCCGHPFSYWKKPLTIIT